MALEDTQAEIPAPERRVLVTLFSAGIANEETLAVSAMGETVSKVLNC